MKKLVIHAGIHRTGTTALQRALVDSRDGMRQFGYCYPGNGPNHQDWAWGLFRAERTASDLRDFLDKESTDCHTIILSGEDFAIHKDLSWLREISGQKFDVQIYLTLRRQDDWLMSWYNQHVRWPFDRRKSQMSPYEFLETIDDYYWLHFDNLVDLWVSSVGEANVHISVMTPKVLESFFSEVLPEMPLPEISKDNSSTSPEALEVLRHLKVFNLGPRKRVKLINSVISSVASEKNTNVYSASIRRMIIDKFDRGNRIIGERYFSDNSSPFGYSIPDNYRSISFTHESSRELLMNSIPKVVEKIL